MEDSEVQLWDSRSETAGMQKCNSRLRILIESAVDIAELPFFSLSPQESHRLEKTESSVVCVCAYQVHGHVAISSGQT